MTHMTFTSGNVSESDVDDSDNQSDNKFKCKILSNLALMFYLYFFNEL